MKAELLKHYGLTNVSLHKMEGYISTNYRVDCDQGRFVLKVYPLSEREDIIAETALIQQLDYLRENEISRPIPNVSGDSITYIIDDDVEKILRLLSFVDGTFLAEAEHTPALFRSLGVFIATIDTKLLHYRNTGIEARKLDWDLQNINVSRQLKQHVTSSEDRKLVDHFFLQWDQHVYPKMSQLRKSIIHNDANDWNVLIKEGKVSGIIDFGDAVHTSLINELAIALTYALFHKEDPISWACYIIQGYHETLPLLEEELDLLYYLIAGRLIMGVCTTANEKKIQPDNKYIVISEAPAWKLLHQWIRINPLFAKRSFYEAAGFESEAIPYSEKSLARRHKSISRGLSVSYKDPIQMAGGAFQYMYDKDGNTYLDAYNNIPHVGHQHPKVVAAGHKQMAALNTNTRYLYDQLPEYAEKLLSKFPANLDKVYFVNSGSAASDLAVRLAQTFTKRKGMVVMEHGYHGNTRMGIEISQYKYNSQGGSGKADHIVQATIPDTFRGKYREVDTGQRYAKDLENQIDKAEIDLAAFIAEPIIGCGGQVPLAPGYLKEVYEITRRRGGICISDEVQTGFGRLGTHFWGYELHGVIPDVIVLGKPMANGHPMGAVVTTSAIAEAFDNGMEFFSSFGGNPVSCAIGSAVLDVIQEEQLQQNANKVGAYYMDQLRLLQKDFPVIGDVRGSGLFIGIEFIKDEHLTPNPKLASLIKNELRNRHILVSTDGPYDSVVKTKPPLCFSKQNVDQVISEISNILKK